MKNNLKYTGELIKSIAGEIDMGMICFLNTDTLEVESVMGAGYDAHNDPGFDYYFREVYDKVDSWQNFIRIEPPESWQSFKIMEGFIETCIPDNDPVKNRLWDAISRRKPFRNFKLIIDNSRYRQDWFDFKQAWMEEFVLEQLSVPEDYGNGDEIDTE